MVRLDCSGDVDLWTASSRVCTMRFTCPTFFCHKSGSFNINRVLTTKTKKDKAIVAKRSRRTSIRGSQVPCALDSTGWYNVARVEGACAMSTRPAERNRCAVHGAEQRAPSTRPSLSVSHHSSHGTKVSPQPRKITQPWPHVHAIKGRKESARYCTRRSSTTTAAIVAHITPKTCARVLGMMHTRRRRAVHA